MTVTVAMATFSRCLYLLCGADRVFDRALEAVGDHPASGGLWRRCVAFEEGQVKSNRREQARRVYCKGVMRACVVSRNTTFSGLIPVE